MVNSLFQAIPNIGNVLLVCGMFWLIFSIMGVQFFGGLFYKCLDKSGEILPASVVPDRNSCLAFDYNWQNSNANFDNALNGFLALLQVVSYISKHLDQIFEKYCAISCCTFHLIPLLEKELLVLRYNHLFAIFDVTIVSRFTIQFSSVHFISF